MKKRTTKFGIVLLALLLTGACASSTKTYQGAAVGGAVGATAGALLDKENRWRGAAIGGALGGVLGGAVTEMAVRASREAAATGRPVAYQSNDGWQRVEAAPMGYNSRTQCHKVRERVWEGGKLVEDRVREICEGEQTTQSY